jgi:branched-chain amino acid transport system ATP-binding protein
MADVVLRASGVGKRFGGLAALTSVDLDLEAGTIHAVIGPNGAGKSTFLATLAGDLTPTTGQVFLGGTDITHHSVEARTHLGIGRTYQRSAVIPGFAAIDMVRLAAMRHSQSWSSTLRRLKNLPDATARAESALARVGLMDRRFQSTDVLSHGERRRLEIASVLALEPKILLLDEPLAGLGPEEAREVVSLFGGLREHCALILIEHDIDVVFSAADVITVLDNGRLIASGKPDDVRASEAVQNAYLGNEGAH